MLRHLAIAASLLQHALALPQAGITAAPSPVVWVTVDASGSAQTVRPAVITTEGHLATVSNAPSALISTATYTLSPSGRASTYTGRAPVASATGTGGSLAGVFPACDTDVGPVEPFCLPKSGSELYPGKTYYITWSPSYFPTPNLQLALHVNYSTTGTGFTSAPLPASQGFYAWTIPADFLASRGNPAPTRYDITFALAYADDATPADNDFERRVGPTVYVTAAPPAAGEDTAGGGGGEGGATRSVVGIAVPVVIVAVLALLGAACAVSWRRTGHMPFAGVVMRRRSAAGGGGAATGDNKSETNVGIQLTDRDSWSPTGRTAGRNVFREEVERQARLG
ncbi:hypothetical protein NEMBOFW57_008036 [Staphylotrichum longicolle]|uniref:Uncharacterized protein n=1 Tax=Staphylotrichum longicolle TaxID=669026 RepID=A0AAD4EUE3_9PEZI|nr:hypothetical protein NEMBOFW57_008036 [Staphylotrichum longicolle]